MAAHLCATASFCIMAVGGGVCSASALVSMSTHLCATASFCIVAVSGDVRATSALLLSMSTHLCATTSFCIVAGGDVCATSALLSMSTHLCATAAMVEDCRSGLGDVHSVSLSMLTHLWARFVSFEVEGEAAGRSSSKPSTLALKRTPAPAT